MPEARLQHIDAFRIVYNVNNICTYNDTILNTISGVNDSEVDKFLYIKTHIIIAHNPLNI